MHTMVYNMVEHHYKTSVLPIAIHLKTADGSPMSLMGKASLHLCIADFKIFTSSLHVPNYQKLIFHLASISILAILLLGLRYTTIHKEKRLIPDLYQTTVSNISTLQSSNLHWKSHWYTMAPYQLRSRDNLRDHIAYFISNYHTKKGLDLKIHVIDSIYDIKCQLTLHVLVANYTNKHVTFKDNA